MRTEVTSEHTYTVGYYKPGTRNTIGISISVSGDSKTKVAREARELLERAERDAREVQAQTGVSTPEMEGGES